MTSPEGGRGMGPEDQTALAAYLAGLTRPQAPARTGFKPLHSLADLPSKGPQPPRSLAGGSPAVPFAVHDWADHTKHPSRRLARTGKAAPLAAAAAAVPCKVDLSAGFADRQATVTVRLARLDLRRTAVGISAARGVLIGSNGCQRNCYQFVVVNPTASIGGLLDGNRTAKLAFARLVENPESLSAGHALKRAVREGPLWTGGAIRASRLTGDNMTRLPVPAPITVGGSKGIVIGDGASQSNRFTYQFIRPQLNMSAAIHARPELARMLAVAIRHPRAEAAQRSFARELDRMFGQATGQAGKLRTGHGLPVISIAGSDGVMLGAGNRRIDVIRRMIEGRFEVRGWDVPGLRPEPPFPSALLPLRTALDTIAAAAARPLNAADAAPPLPLVPGTGGPGLPVPAPGAGRTTRTPEVSLAPPPDGDGAVVRGPAAAIAAAMKTGFLDAATLRAYVHRRLQAGLQHRPADQLAQAVRDLAGLREILFPDPEPGISLRDAVDPQTGTAAVTSALTTGISGDPASRLAASTVSPSLGRAAKPGPGYARASIWHVSTDKATFAEPLAQELASLGTAPRLDTWQTTPVDNLMKKLLDTDLTDASAVILVISAASVADPWIPEELSEAVVRRITSSAQLIPVRLDNAIMPAPIRHLSWINADRTQEGIRAAAAQITKALHGTGPATDPRTT